MNLEWTACVKGQSYTSAQCTPTPAAIIYCNYASYFWRGPGHEVMNTIELKKNSSFKHFKYDCVYEHSAILGLICSLGLYFSYFQETEAHVVAIIIYCCLIGENHFNEHK